MKNVYLIATVLCCSAIAITACEPSADPEGPTAAVTTAVSAPTMIVTAGLGHSCAAGSAGIQCWGSNGNGQLGNGSSAALSIQPVSVTGIMFGTTMIAAGGQHTCAIVNGAARCWGGNSVGQLGNSPPNTDGTTLPDSHVPVAVTGLSSGVQAIAAGNSHGCAVVNGAAKCWGVNDFGQLGDNSVQLHRSPVPVSTLSSGVQAVTAGGSHSCAIVGGAALCWGFNGNGQLGNATAGNPQPGDSQVPVPVTGLTSGVQAIAAGQNHTCALVNGGVMCWGNNAFGQLGNGATGPTPVRAPVQVTGLTSGVLAIAGGLNHTCAILTGGVAKCWGANNDGQLGNGSTDPNAPLPPPSNVPVQVTGLTSDVQTIATGFLHSCATTSSGVWCWGFNGNGQLALDPDMASLLGAPHRITGVVVGGCADGNDEQVFNNGMVGCAGAVAFGNRGALCAAGYQPATTLQWTSNRGATTPTHDYWTNDLLRYNGFGPSACFVSLSVGSDCGASTPMRVCNTGGTDPEGNFCNWTQCGLYANAPNQFFGGCAGNTTAGTMCIPASAPANACTHFNSCPKWENGFSTSTSTEFTGIFGSSRNCTQFCQDAGVCRQPICSGSMSQPTAACQSAVTSRLNNLRSSIQSLVTSEASFDSPQALQQRSAEAQAAANVTPSYAPTDFNFSQNCDVNSACQLFWSEHIECELNVVTPNPTNAANEACGCAP